VDELVAADIRPLQSKDSARDRLVIEDAVPVGVVGRLDPREIDESPEDLLVAYVPVLWDRPRNGDLERRPARCRCARGLIESEREGRRWMPLRAATAHPPDGVGRPLEDIDELEWKLGYGCTVCGVADSPRDATAHPVDVLAARHGRDTFTPRLAQDANLIVRAFVGPIAALTKAAVGVDVSEPVLGCSRLQRGAAAKLGIAAVEPWWLGFRIRNVRSELGGLDPARSWTHRSWWTRRSSSPSLHRPSTRNSPRR